MTSGSPSSGETAIAGVPPAVLAEIESHLRAREARREEIYGRARDLRRLAQRTMMRLHTEPPPEADLREIRERGRELAAGLRRDGRGDEGIAADALQEAVEALLLGAVATGAPWPGPGDLGIDPEPYLLGLGDLVGEVRRRALDRLGHDDLAGAERELGRMEAIVRALLHFDTTRAIVPLKPKQDAARALLERTRGEVVMARLLLGRRAGTGGGGP